MVSTDLIRKLISVTKPNSDKVTEKVVYGSTVAFGNDIRVRLDGSDIDTPVESTAGLKAGERVTVMVKNHTAVVTGNTTVVSARKDDMDDAKEKIDSANKAIDDANTAATDANAAAKRAYEAALAASQAADKAIADAANAKTEAEEAKEASSKTPDMRVYFLTVSTASMERNMSSTSVTPTSVTASAYYTTNGTDVIAFEGYITASVAYGADPYTFWASVNQSTELTVTPSSLMLVANDVPLSSIRFELRTKQDSEVVATEYVSVSEDAFQLLIKQNDGYYLDGGLLGVDTVKANSIDVVDLFAQNITASGTISGATLKGTNVLGAKLILSEDGYTDNPYRLSDNYNNLNYTAIYINHDVDSLADGSGSQSSCEIHLIGTVNYSHDDNTYGYATHSPNSYGSGYYGENSFYERDWLQITPSGIFLGRAYTAVVDNAQWDSYNTVSYGETVLYDMVRLDQSTQLNGGSSSEPTDMSDTIQSGFESTNITIAENSVGVINVSFPKDFSSRPNVVATLRCNSTASRYGSTNIAVNSITRSGFSCYIYNRNSTSNGNMTISPDGIEWIATNT